MKNALNAIFIIPCAVILISFDCATEIFFEKRETCTFEVDIKSLMSIKYTEILENYFCSDEVLRTVVASLCMENQSIYYSDSTLRLSDSYMDVEYKEGYAQHAFNSLLTACKDPDNIPEKLFDYFKPGKIVCLSSSKRVLRIITLNSCADMKMLDKLILCIKGGRPFDKAFAVKCGVYNGVFELQ